MKLDIFLLSLNIASVWSRGFLTGFSPEINEESPLFTEEQNSQDCLDRCYSKVSNLQTFCSSKSVISRVVACHSLGYLGLQELCFLKDSIFDILKNICASGILQIKICKYCGKGLTFVDVIKKRLKAHKNWAKYFKAFIEEQNKQKAIVSTLIYGISELENTHNIVTTYHESVKYALWLKHNKKSKFNKDELYNNIYSFHELLDPTNKAYIRNIFGKNEKLAKYQGFSRHFQKGLMKVSLNNTNEPTLTQVFKELELKQNCSNFGQNLNQSAFILESFNKLNSSLYKLTNYVNSQIKNYNSQNK